MMLMYMYIRLNDLYCFFFFQAEDGIRDLVRSRGLGDVYKRQPFILHLFIAALAERGAAGAVVRVLDDFQEQPELVKNAILSLYYLHYWEAVTSASEAFLKKEALSPAWRRELEDIMLFIAEQTGDTAVSYTHLRAHETVLDLVCRLLLEKKKHHTKHKRRNTMHNTHM